MTSIPGAKDVMVVTPVPEAEMASVVLGSAALCFLVRVTTTYSGDSVSGRGTGKLVSNNESGHRVAIVRVMSSSEETAASELAVGVLEDTFVVAEAAEAAL